MTVDKPVPHKVQLDPNDPLTKGLVGCWPMMGSGPVAISDLAVLIRGKEVT